MIYSLSSSGFFCLPLIRCSWHTLSFFLSIFLWPCQISSFTLAYFSISRRGALIWMELALKEEVVPDQQVISLEGLLWKRKCEELCWWHQWFSNLYKVEGSCIRYSHTHTNAHTYFLASEATGMRRGNTLWYLDCFVIISHTWFVKIKAILKHSVKVCFLMFRNPDRHSKTPKKTLKWGQNSDIKFKGLHLGNYITDNQSCLMHQCLQSCTTSTVTVGMDVLQFFQIITLNLALLGYMVHLVKNNIDNIIWSVWFVSLSVCVSLDMLKLCAWAGAAKICYTEIWSMNTLQGTYFFSFDSSDFSQLCEVFPIWSHVKSPSYI